MRITPPEIEFSVEGRRLLNLLVRLTAELDAVPRRLQNAQRDIIRLSDQELDELSSLLDQYVKSQDYFLKSQFIEGLFEAFGRPRGNALRKIYIDERVRRGRQSRIMSGRQWNEFLICLGKGANVDGRRVVNRMSFDHFIRMEHKLFEILNFGHKVKRFLLSSANKLREKIESWRDWTREIRVFSIKSTLIDPIQKNCEK